MIVTPSIDVLEGQCVRLQQGDFQKVAVYPRTPLEVAQNYATLGFREIHIVDLQGSRRDQPLETALIERIVGETGLVVQFGGGLRRASDVQHVLDCGAQRVVLGTVAARDPHLLQACVDTYGAQRIVVAADMRDERVLVDAWRSDSGRKLMEFLADLKNRGVQRLLCTDIARDGVLTGPATELYQRLKGDHPEFHLTASGGVRSQDDVVALERLGVEAVVIGKALLDGDIDAEQLALLYGGAGHVG